jgi:hypothetical protein
VSRRGGQLGGLSVVRRLALAPLAVAAALSGCGGITAPDLFIIQRSGSDPSAKLTLLVNEEGGVSCNGVSMLAGRKLKLSDPQLVQARAIQEDLSEPASKHVSSAPRPGSVLSYRVRDEAGSLSFSDNSAGQPPVFRRLALFVLQTAQRVCHLPE